MKALLLLPLTALVFAGCDSKQEQARKAELEAKADRLENAADATKDSAKADANAVKKEGEARADALKTEAERTREQK